DPFLIVVLAFTLSIAIGFPWVLSSGIRGMHFRVGPDGIAVHHLGRQLFRWESIRRVERLDQPPRLWRIFGAHLPGYYAGLFSAGIGGLPSGLAPDGIAVHPLGRRLFRGESPRRGGRLDRPPRLWRIFGAHLPGYYAGLFSAGPLGRVRVYGTTLRPPLILLETSRGRVILEPADAEAFLAAVQAYR